MKKAIAVILSITLLFGTLCGCSNKKTESKSTASAGAATQEKQTGKLTIYAASLENECIAIGKAFQEKTGIKTNVVVLGGGEVLARVRAEKNNATASVWWGGPCDSHMQAQKEGLLTQYNSPTASQIPAKYKDPNGYWNGVYIGYLGFCCNTKRLKELGISAPKSWQDLLSPKLKGEIVCGNPAASSTGYVLLSTVTQLMGEQQGMDYMAKLKNQTMQMTERGTGWITPVSTGEAAVGICFLQDAINLEVNGKYEKDHFTLSTPSEGTGYELGAAAILKSGPDQASAKKFIDWCLTPEAQAIDQKYGHFVFLTNENAKQPEAAASLKETTKLINYDFAKAGEQKSALIAEFQQKTGTK